MRTLLIASVALVLSAVPAAAEFPLTLDAELCPGIGVGGHRGSSAGPFGAIAAVDVLLDRGDGRRWLLSGLVSAIGAPGGRAAVYEPGYRLDAVGMASVIGGIESSRNDGGAFMQLGLGCGRMQLEARGSAEDDARWGLALGAHFGVRLIPPPGPVGLLVGVRSHHVVGIGAHGNVIALGIGLAIDPR